MVVNSLIRIIPSSEWLKLIKDVQEKLHWTFFLSLTERGSLFFTFSILIISVQGSIKSSLGLHDVRRSCSCLLHIFLKETKTSRIFPRRMGKEL